MTSSRNRSEPDHRGLDMAYSSLERFLWLEHNMLCDMYVPTHGGQVRFPGVVSKNQSGTPTVKVPDTGHVVIIDRETLTSG